MSGHNCEGLSADLAARLERARPGQPLPVIILLKQAAGPKSLMLQAGHFPVKCHFPAICGMAAALTPEQIRQVTVLPQVERVEHDRKVEAFLDSAGHWFGATAARADFGVSGDGDGQPSSYSNRDVVIAVVDTGIDSGHADLGGGKVTGWLDLVNGRAAPYDDNGHGTHVASIAAGTGTANPRYTGVAPGSALVGVKVLDSVGSGNLSDVLAGVQWVLENRDRFGIRILNLSLGIRGCNDGSDSLCQMVDRVAAAGIVAVVAAGNDGPATCTVGSPGAAAGAITVGAMSDVGEDGFFLASFSGRGPTADGRTKPDIVAPGYRIHGARAGSAEEYVALSGTSMATPFVAGTVALMLAAKPSLTPDDVRRILCATAVDWGPAEPDGDYGAGRLDAHGSVQAAGGFPGSGPVVPHHSHQSGRLSGRRQSQWYEVPVTSTDYPIAVTLLMPDWRSRSRPDFDLYLYDPGNRRVAASEGTTRQETIHHQPETTGTYRIRLYSYAGGGRYFLDVSAGSGEVALRRVR